MIAAPAPATATFARAGESAGDEATGAITTTTAVVPRRRRPARWWPCAPRRAGRSLRLVRSLPLCVANSTLTARLSMTFPSRPSMAAAAIAGRPFPRRRSLVAASSCNQRQVGDTLPAPKRSARPPCPCCSPDFCIIVTLTGVGLPSWHLRVYGRGQRCAPLSGSATATAFSICARCGCGCVSWCSPSLISGLRGRR